jgi:hypothetical protein
MSSDHYETGCHDRIRSCRHLPVLGVSLVIIATYGVIYYSEYSVIYYSSSGNSVVVPITDVPPWTKTALKMTNRYYEAYNPAKCMQYCCSH